MYRSHELVRIVALLFCQSADVGIAQERQRNFIELQVTASGGVELGNFLPEDIDHILPVLLDVGINVSVDRILELAEMHVRRRRHGDLDALARRRLQEFEILGDDRTHAADPLGRNRRRRGRRKAVLVAECEFRGAEIEAFDGAQEAARPAAAPKLAVGNDLKPELLLHFDSIANGAVLSLAQHVEADLAGLPIAPRLHEIRWAFQAADVIDGVGRDA